MVGSITAITFHDEWRNIYMLPVTGYMYLPLLKKFLDPIDVHFENCSCLGKGSFYGMECCLYPPL